MTSGGNNFNHFTENQLTELVQSFNLVDARASSASAFGHWYEACSWSVRKIKHRKEKLIYEHPRH